MKKRSKPGRHISLAEEFVRLFAMLVVLKPAAATLPRSVALFLANLLALGLLLIPSQGPWNYWQVRDVFGLGHHADGLLQIAMFFHPGSSGGAGERVGVDRRQRLV